MLQQAFDQLQPRGGDCPVPPLVTLNARLDRQAGEGQSALRYEDCPSFSKHHIARFIRPRDVAGAVRTAPEVCQHLRVDAVVFICVYMRVDTRLSRPWPFARTRRSLCAPRRSGLREISCCGSWWPIASVVAANTPRLYEMPDAAVGIVLKNSKVLV